MNISNLFQSKTFRGILYGIGICVIALIILQVGIFIGYKKAFFSGKFGDNYSRNFANPRHEFMREFQGKDMMNGHGVAGEILKIGDSDLIMKDRNGVEKNILVKNDTIIKRRDADIKLSDLKVNEHIVVIGSPNDAGQIEAKLMRVLPFPPPFLMPPPSETQGTSTESTTTETTLPKGTTPTPSSQQ